MCVEEESLSAYIDGELGGGELREVEEHLQSCERCRAAEARLRGVTQRLQEGDAGESLPVEDARARVRGAISRRTAGGRHPGLRRGVYLPLPAALSAAAVFLLLIGALIGMSLERNAERPAVAERQAESLAEKAAAKEAGMEELIRFLSSQGASVEVRIQLPSSGRFTVRGEPQLMKAADFKGY